MPKASAEVGGAAHLPKEPIEGLSAGAMFLGHKGVELRGEVEQNRAGLEDSRARLGASIEQGRYL